MVVIQPFPVRSPALQTGFYAPNNRAGMPQTLRPETGTQGPGAFEEERGSIAGDLRSGPRSFALLVASQVVSSLCAFAALWLATRLLGPTGYGGIAAILAAGQLVGQVSAQWTGVALVRFGCEEFVATGRAPEAFWTRLFLLLPNLAIVLLAAPLWLPWVGAWLQLPLGEYPIVLLYMVAMLFWSHVQNALLAVKLPRVQGLLLALERILVVVALLILARRGEATTAAVAGAYTGASLLMAAVGTWWVRSLIVPRPGWNAALARRMVRFSLPLIPTALFGYLSTHYLDALFITQLLSTRDLGIYSVAYQFAGTVMQLPLLLSYLILPVLVTLQVRSLDDGIASFMREMLPLLTLGWSVVCVLLAILISAALPLLFGSEFRQSSTVLWPLMVAATFAGPGQMGCDTVTKARSVTRVTAIGAGLAAATNVTLNVLLIPRFGLIGCAWATAGAYAMSVAVQMRCLHRELPSGRGWTLHATLPSLLAAAIWSGNGGAGTALAAALGAAAVLTWAHRGAIRSGLARLAEARHPEAARSVAALVPSGNVDPSRSRAGD
jgi:O-antigen/teichoic acid export membrane protein